MIVKDNITKSGGLATCAIFATSAATIFLKVTEIFDSTYINIVVILIYFGCLTYTLSIRGITFNNQEILLFLFLAATLIFHTNNGKIMDLIGLLALSATVPRNKFTLPIWFVNFLHSSVFIYFLYSLVYIESPSKLFYILPGHYDTNFTAYTFLLYLIFSLKNKSMLGILLGVTGGLLTYSRAFIYSSILIVILLVSQNSLFKINFSSRRLTVVKKLTNLIVKLTNLIVLFKGKFIFVSMILIINFSIYLYGGVIVHNFHTDKLVSRSTLKRAFVISNSDSERFEANDYVISYFYKNPQEFLFGGSLSYDDLAKKSGMKTPHNGLIQTTLGRGFLFNFLYLTIVGFILNRFDATKNIVFWLPPFLFSGFLHVGFSISEIALIVIIVGMQENSIKNSWFSIPFLSLILKLFPRKLKNG